MIVFERFGHTFRIRNNDWKKLRERFNPKNAVEYGYKSVEIEIPCSLCMLYDSGRDCHGCPFSSFGHNGCLDFLRKLFREPKFQTGRERLVWNIANNSLVRRQLNRMQKIMDKIEKENQHENQK
ncbi:unnamed protein product [marine sediment metagenome]|uniref:Uncharacterized protein n=1 Tax=marine sediment metagenome TaxID=412755 RepID=X1ETA9_9ZZZZ